MKNKNKVYLISTSFIIINLAILFFLVLPLFKDIKEKSNVLVNIKNENFSFDDQINKLNEFNKNKDNYTNNFKKAELMFSDSQNPILFIKSIEDIAKESNVVLDILLVPGVDKRLNNDFWPSVVFQINSVGSFSSILKFLTKLENAPYLALVQNLKINKNETTSKPRNNSNLDIKASYLVKVFTK